MLDVNGKLIMPVVGTTTIDADWMADIVDVKLG
jgi:hypothetical protein